MKLSIAVVTMNREKQLIEALLSCAACKLPSETQFVIIDNASNDNTESSVARFFQEHSFEYYYEKLPQNIGCGNGRNYAYMKSKGDYVYFMDDDAYIDENYNDFFIKAIAIFEHNTKIATLTTQIYDLVWQRNRIYNPTPQIDGDIRYCYMLCGGSHFLARSFFAESNPYFPNKYGYEEILPSLRVIDAGYINAFVDSLCVIHNPLVNKWDYNIKSNEALLIKGIAIPRVMKEKYYPLIVYPFIHIAYMLRCIRYLNLEQINQANKMIKEMSNTYEWGSRIKLKSVFKMFKYFGFTIF